jgi:hypothetical protein
MSAPIVISFRTLDWLPGYRFGSDGRMWSAWKRKGGNGGDAWMMVVGDRWREIGTSLSRGYPTICIPSQIAEGRGVTRKLDVHRLVCEAFHGPAPHGMEVAHLDGVRHHNAPSNLQWCTHRDNMEQSRDHGTMPMGERHGMSRLRAADIVEIRQLHAAGASLAALGRKYGVRYQSIRRIVRREHWRHVA